MEPENPKEHFKSAEYWLDQAVWPEPDMALKSRIMAALDAREPETPAAFMLLGRATHGGAFGGRGFLMMAVILGLGAGIVGRSEFGATTTQTLQAPVYAGSGLAMAQLMNGDNE